MEPQGRRWLLPLLTFLYLFPFPYFPALRSPNEGSRLYQARALIDDGTFAVNGPLARYGSIGDLSVIEGRYYPNKAPGISIAGALVYAVARAFGGGAAGVSNGALLYLLRVCLSGIPTLLLLGPLRRRLWRWTADGTAADIALTTYALGSLAYTYGLLFFSHQLTAVLLTGSWLCLESAREEQRLKPVALAGLMAGAAVLTEYTAAIAALPLGLYALLALPRGFRSCLAFGVAALPPLILLLAYHHLAYGGFFETGYRHNVNQAFQAWHSQGFMGVTTPTLLGLFGSFFDPARGLLIFSPFLALVPVGLWALSRQPGTRAPFLLMLSLLVLYTAFTACFIYEAWGWTVGPRHLAPLAGLMAAPAGLGLAVARSRSAIAGGVAVGLCLLSVVLTSLATVVYPHFPEAFSNGFFELTVPLLQGGFLPENAFTFWFGWGAWTWLGYWVALGGVFAWIAWCGPRQRLGMGLALATFTVGLATLSLVGRGARPDKQAMLDFVRQTYRQR